MKRLAAATAFCGLSTLSTLFIPASAQINDYQLPPANVSTCVNLRRYRNEADQYYGVKASWNDYNRMVKQQKKLDAVFEPWIKKCLKLCRSISPRKPAGNSWQLSPYSGGKNGCGHRWVRLDRRHGDRIYVSYTNTEQLDPESSQWITKYGPTEYIIKCSTRDVYRARSGWVPIRPSWAPDGAVLLFC